jgi:hypothetical protein
VSSGAKGWRSALEEQREAVRAARGDPLAKARVIAQLATAAAKHVDTAQLEDDVAQLEKEQAQVAVTRKHGPRSERAYRPAEVGPVAGEPVR